MRDWKSEYDIIHALMARIGTMNALLRLEAANYRAAGKPTKAEYLEAQVEDSRNMCRQVVEWMAFHKDGE